MESYEQRVPILEFLSEKPGVSLSVFSKEAPNTLGELIRDTFDDLQRSQVQLREHVAALESKNRELEACASTAAHDLKQPLSVIILISNLITKVPDLTDDELKEYLGQIHSIQNGHDHQDQVAFRYGKQTRRSTGQSCC